MEVKLIDTITSRQQRYFALNFTVVMLYSNTSKLVA